MYIIYTQSQLLHIHQLRDGTQQNLLWHRVFLPLLGNDVQQTLRCIAQRASLLPCGTANSERRQYQNRNWTWNSPLVHFPAPVVSGAVVRKAATTRDEQARWDRHRAVTTAQPRLSSGSAAAQQRLSQRLTQATSQPVGTPAASGERLIKLLSMYICGISRCMADEQLSITDGWRTAVNHRRVTDGCQSPTTAVRVRNDRGEPFIRHREDRAASRHWSFIARSSWRRHEDLLRSRLSLYHRLCITSIG